jgi:hypothetical protein
MSKAPPEKTPWLLAQWDDIKGNAKFAILLIAGGAVIDWIRNGSWPEVFGVGVALIIALILLLVGTTKRHKIVGYISLLVSFIGLAVSVIGHEIKRHSVTIAVSSQTNHVAPGIQVVASNNQGVLVGVNNGTVNNGISESAMRELLQKEFLDRNAELADKYPQGYALLGMASGQIVFEPKLKQTKVDADWSQVKISESGGAYEVILDGITITVPGRPTYGFKNIAFIFSKSPGAVTRDPFLGLYYLETIDANRGIFLMGFK